jgi:uncharacterized protein (TIGR02453 family)
MSFTGFPEAALDFYDDLELDNTRAFWDANKHVYADAVAGPAKALAQELTDEFGQVKIFRPYRDVRFAKDKTPYKTHQGMFVAQAPATGYYFQIGAPGVRVGGGFYEASPARLANIRAAIDDPGPGTHLRRILDELRATGWEVGGDRLKTAPRGYDVSHPRIDLLRHRSLTVGKSYGFDPVIHTAELVDRVRADWRECAPLIAWVVRHASG